MGEPLYVRIKRNVSREELAIIENRILERDMAAKRRAEKLAKNIAVTFFTFTVTKSKFIFAKQSVKKEEKYIPHTAKKTTCPSP